MADGQLNVWDLGPAPARSTSAAPVKVPAPVAADRVPPDEFDGVPPPADVAGAADGVAVPAAPSAVAPSAVAPSARRVFDELLNPPQDRPVAPPDAAGRVREVLAPYAAAAGVWPEPTLRLGKAQVVAVGNCEGLSVASRQQGYSGRLPLPVVVGQVAHKAVQMLWTHPGHAVPTYVRAAVSGCADDSSDFAEFWASAHMAAQSDVVAQATARVASFADSFPPLLDEWSPRFEEQVSARVGPLVVVGRPDFMLGRPRPNGLRTMVVCDVKSGELRDSHRFEALLYAMLLTLRHGVPPWRSTVMSLASGEWTDPDFTVDDLCEVADRVGSAAVALAQVWSQAREPVLTPGPFCRWCPAAASCPSVAES